MQFSLNSYSHAKLLSISREVYRCTGLQQVGTVGRGICKLLSLEVWTVVDPGLTRYRSKITGLGIHISVIWVRKMINSLNFRFSSKRTAMSDKPQQIQLSIDCLMSLANAPFLTQIAATPSKCITTGHSVIPTVHVYATEKEMTQLSCLFSFNPIVKGLFISVIHFHSVEFSSPSKSHHVNRT